MGRLIANWYWYMRRWWGHPRVDAEHRVGQRLDNLAGRVMMLEAAQRRMWEEGWRVPPAPVTHLRSVPLDDN